MIYRIQNLGSDSAESKIFWIGKSLLTSVFNLNILTKIKSNNAMFIYRKNMICVLLYPQIKNFQQMIVDTVNKLNQSGVSIVKTRKMKLTNDEATRLFIDESPESILCRQKAQQGICVWFFNLIKLIISKWLLFVVSFFLYLKKTFVVVIYF